MEYIIERYRRRADIGKMGEEEDELGKEMEERE